jgi:fructokinase
MTDVLFGVDLGGTKIAACALKRPGAGNGEQLELLAKIEVPTPKAAGYEAVLSGITEVINLVAAEVGVTPEIVGIGTPGVLDRHTGLLKNSNTLCLNGMPVLSDLQRVSGKRLLIENDANCFALAEAHFGASRGSKLSFGIIMGTGVGGGLVIDGAVRYGAQGIAGEWGHNVLDPNGLSCYCGKQGCVETQISGPALERYYFERSGRSLCLEEIVREAERGEVAAVETINRLCASFGQAVSVLVNILDPDCIVLGGGVSNVDALYTQGVEELKSHIFNKTPRATIVRNQLGDDAGVLGAAMLVCGAL